MPADPIVSAANPRTIAVSRVTRMRPMLAARDVRAARSRLLNSVTGPSPACEMSARTREADGLADRDPGRTWPPYRPWPTAPTGETSLVGLADEYRLRGGLG